MMACGADSTFLGTDDGEETGLRLGDGPQAHAKVGTQRIERFGCKDQPLDEQGDEKYQCFDHDSLSGDPVVVLQVVSVSDYILDWKLAYRLKRILLDAWYCVTKYFVW